MAPFTRSRKRQFAKNNNDEAARLQKVFRIASVTIDVPVEAPKKYRTRNAIHIDQFPAFLMIQIFEHLDIGSKLRAGLVSHRWAYLQKFSWRNSDTITREDILPLAFLRAEVTGNDTSDHWETCRKWLGRTGIRRLDSLMTLCNKTLKHLNLSGLKPYFVNPFCAITKRIFNLVMHINANQLQKLDLSGIGLNHSQLVALADRFPALKVASFVDSLGRIDSAVSYFLSKCNSLESLDLSGNIQFSGKPSFKMLPPTLKTLKLLSCAAVGSYALEQIQIQCPKLKELEVDEMRSFNASAWDGLVTNLTW